MACLSVEGMFLQVGVVPDDNPSLRFLWREDPAAEVAVFQYVRHIFGSKESPTCANYALRRTTTDNATQFPEAAQSVINNFYMNDYLESSPTINEAVRKAKDLVKLLLLGGFKLMKFVSNVRSIPPQVETNSKTPTETKETPSTVESSHVLRLKWIHNSGTHVVSRGRNREVKAKVTQRVVFELILFSVRSDRTCRAVYHQSTTTAKRHLEVMWTTMGRRPTAGSCIQVP